MWVIAGAVMAAMVAIALIPGAGRAGLPIGIALGLMAYRVYVQHAIGALAKARRPDGVVDPQEIARTGGVSRMAGWIGGVIYGLPVLISIVSIVVLVQAGDPVGPALSLVAGGTLVFSCLMMAWIWTRSLRAMRPGR